MGSTRDDHLDKKLDMSLDDLCDSKGNRRSERSRSPYTERRDSRGDESRGRFGGGKGKGKRRMAPEDKALVNTRCSIDGEGGLVVRLYNTEVVILRKRPETAEVKKPETPNSEKASADDTKDAPEVIAADAPKKPESADAKNLEVDDGKKPEADGTKMPEADGVKKADTDELMKSEAGDVKKSEDEEVKTETGGVKKSEDEDVKTEADGANKSEVADEKKPEADESKPQADDGTKPEAGKPPAASDEGEAKPEATDGVVLVLNSGGFRTIETRYVINEALGPLSLRVLEADSQTWTVSGSLAGEKPFEDKMELHIKCEEELRIKVKQHIEDKIQLARERDRLAPRRPSRGDDYQNRRDFGPPQNYPPHQPGGYRPGMPPPGHHWPPPPGWHGHPPPAWGGPPQPYGAAGGAPHHRPPPYGGAPPGATGGPPARPSGPLPDSMFQ